MSVAVEICRRRVRHDEPPDDRVCWLSRRVDGATMMDRSAARSTPVRMILGAPCRSHAPRRHEHGGAVGEGRTRRLDGSH